MTANASPPLQAGPLDDENRQLRQLLAKTARLLNAARDFDPYALGSDGKPGAEGAERSHFLVTSWGHSASIWLAGSLNLHDDILCNCGIEHPLNSFSLYPLNKDWQAWRQADWPSLFGFGIRPERLELTAEQSARIGAPPPPPSRRDYDSLPSFVFDELERLADAVPHRVIGNVHGITLPQLVAVQRQASPLFGGRRVPVVNLIRHPVPRTESAIKATMHYHMDDLKADIDRLIDENAAECRAMERRFKVDFTQPRARTVLHVYRQGLQNVVWAEEIRDFPWIKSVLMERLQTDSDYFATVFGLLTQQRLAITDAYLDRVFSAENLGSGRRGAARQGTRPPAARDQFALWSDFEREEFRRCADMLSLRDVYAPFDYDFSFCGSL
ncbi:MAG TPA: hypothetical protein VK558_14415 [Patescibacteria group bacterium]|nr:hypothetical protein [Patescibacteria group bacterium]